MKELRWLREEPKSHAFFYFYFYFFYFMCFVLINYGEQRLRAALVMLKKKPHPLSLINPGTREKTINLSLSGPRPTAHQPCKIRNETPTKGAEQESQINTWEESTGKPLP